MSNNPSASATPDSPGLRLRAPEPDDAPFICSLENISLEEGYSERVVPLSEQSVKSYIAAIDPDPFSSGQLRLMVCMETGERIGLLDYYDITLLHRRAMIGIIVAPAMRNRGLGTRILRLACAFGRRHLRLERLGALVGEKNTASRRIFTKAGFKVCGKLDEWWSDDDGTENCFFFLKKLSRM